MRTSMQPLAHLVDAAAEKWLAAEASSVIEQQDVAAEITQAFRIGGKPELTFHGLRYLLTVSQPADTQQFGIAVHEIATDS